MQCSFFPRRHLAFYRLGSLQLKEPRNSLCVHARKGFGKKVEGRPVNKDKVTYQYRTIPNPIAHAFLHWAIALLTLLRLPCTGN